MVNVSKEDLEYISEYGQNYGKPQSGYRIVYFYSNGAYEVGTFSGTIEDFMTDFALVEPIEDESDIPKFISIEDLLNRYLNDIKNIKSVAIYKTDGTLVAMKDKEN